MTIAASVKVRDGIVLATDSMVQINTRLPNGEFAVIKSYRHGLKLFRILEKSIGVMSWGIGNIGARSIEGLIQDFCQESSTYVKEDAKTKDWAKGLQLFIKTIYDDTFAQTDIKQRPVLGFFVGGYSSQPQFAEEYEFLLPQKEAIKLVRPADKFGASWRGIVLPFRRLYHGFDSRIPDELKSLGVSDEILNKVFRSGKWNLPFVYDGMPLQDAVDHAIFILKTTIDTATFEVGPAPTCGGPIQAAAITPDGTWTWINKAALSMPEGA